MQPRGSAVQWWKHPALEHAGKSIVYPDASMSVRLLPFSFFFLFLLLLPSFCCHDNLHIVYLLDTPQNLGKDGVRVWGKYAKRCCGCGKGYYLRFALNIQPEELWRSGGRTQHWNSSCPCTRGAGKNTQLRRPRDWGFETGAPLFSFCSCLFSLLLTLSVLFWSHTARLFASLFLTLHRLGTLGPEALALNELIVNQFYASPCWFAPISLASSRYKRSCMRLICRMRLHLISFVAAPPVYRRMKSGEVVFASFSARTQATKS